MVGSSNEASAEVPQYPLSGITVIDLSHVYNGPYATFLMAMAGANVIKVEPLHGRAPAQPRRPGRRRATRSRC